MKKICASLETIEHDILIDIVERVSSRSFKYLINQWLRYLLKNYI